MELDTLHFPDEAAKMLSERSGRTVTVDDLRQMRRRGRIEGIQIAVNLYGYTDEQIASATIPVERQPAKKKKRRKRKSSASGKLTQ